MPDGFKEVVRGQMMVATEQNDWKKKRNDNNRTPSLTGNILGHQPTPWDSDGGQSWESADGKYHQWGRALHQEHGLQ